MMQIDEALDKVKQWFDSGCIGNLIIFRAPRSTYVDMIAEEVTKIHEMDRQSQDLVRDLFETFDTEKLEAYRDKNGYADRIKTIRRL